MRYIRQKKYLPLLLIAIFAASLTAALLFAKPAAAQTTEYESGWQIIPKECLGRQGANDEPCNLNSFINLFVNLAKVGLKVLPYLAMIMMIYAGFSLIMAGGNPQKIEEGKRMVSSVVIGVIIILFLAWCYSYFVVFVLTGSTKVFPNYPWEKEWWGGGTATTTTASLGCCVNTTSQWCQEQLNEDDCIGQGGSFQGNGSACADSQAVCANFAVGCCLPDVGGAACYSPDGSAGCSNHLGYHLDQDRYCSEIPQCYISSVGCCVPDNPPNNQNMWQSCGPTEARGDCTAYPDTTFRDGVHCFDVPICRAGCCVPRCRAGLNQASEYWCRNSGLGTTTFHSGGCTDLETEIAGCCYVPPDQNQGPSQSTCYTSNYPNQINRQYCSDLGGTWDSQTCANSGLDCDTTIPLSNDFCGT